MKLHSDSACKFAEINVPSLSARYHLKSVSFKVIYPAIISSAAIMTQYDDLVIQCNVHSQVHGKISDAHCQPVPNRVGSIDGLRSFGSPRAEGNRGSLAPWG